MHEYSIAAGIVNAVLPVARERGMSVRRIWVKAGVLKAIVPEALEFCFDALKRRHSLLRGAELVLEVVPITGKCRRCGAEIELSRVLGVCPSCGSTDVEWKSGGELYVEKVELAAEENPPCEASDER